VGDEFGDAKEIVGGADQVSSELSALSAAVSTSPQASDGLDPAKDLLDAPADPLTESIAEMAHGATSDGGAAVRVLSEMRGDVGVTAVTNEIGAVVAAVSSDGDAATSLALLEHLDRGLSFATPRGLAHAQVDQ